MLNSKLRGPVRRGWPAFGCALTGTDAYRTRSSATVSIRCGPIVQLVPSMATGRADSTVATSRGVSPPRVCASSAKVAWAMTGTSARSAGHADRLDQLVEVAERLQDEQVHARSGAAGR